MDMPFMMLEKIKDAAKRSRACLFYGMVFTLIFIKFGVGLEGDDLKRMMHTNYYNE